jgi:hypothetical protein
MCFGSVSAPPGASSASNLDAQGFEEPRAGIQTGVSRGYAAGDAAQGFSNQLYQNSLPWQQALQALTGNVSGAQQGAATNAFGYGNNAMNAYQNMVTPINGQAGMNAFGGRWLNPDNASTVAGIMSGNSNLSPQDRMLALNGIQSQSANAAGDYAAGQTTGMQNSMYNQAMRQSQRMGLNPNQIAASFSKNALGNSAQGVTAANQARNQAYDTMYQNQGVAANMGQNMASVGSTQMGLGGQLGSSAVGNANTGFMSGVPYGQLGMGGYGMQLGAAGAGMQGNIAQGGLMSSLYNSNINAWNMGNQANAANAAGWGNLAGGILGNLGNLTQGLQTIKSWWPG